VAKRFSSTEKATAPVAVIEGKVSPEPNEFDQMLLNAVDEALMHLFNETAAKAIYTYLENMYNLKREDIAEKTGIFSASLKRLLDSGARARGKTKMPIQGLRKNV
jgi:hypothetical protein